MGSLDHHGELNSIDLAATYQTGISTIKSNITTIEIIDIV